MAKKTKAQLKSQSRKVFVVKSGGPAASTITRSSPVISHLDDLLDSVKLAGEEVVAVSVEELRLLQADGDLVAGQFYQLTDGTTPGLLVSFNAPDAVTANGQLDGKAGSYAVATGKFVNTAAPLIINGGNPAFKGPRTTNPYI